MLLLRLEREKGLVPARMHGRVAPSAFHLRKGKKHVVDTRGRFSHPFSHIPIDVCTVVDLPVPQGKTCGLVLEDQEGRL